MGAPDGYTEIGVGLRCRCPRMWQEPDGSVWCCNAGKLNLGASPDRDATSLREAERLYERFCSDLLRDAGMARTRLIAGIQIAIRDA